MVVLCVRQFGIISSIFLFRLLFGKCWLEPYPWSINIIINFELLFGSRDVLYYIRLLIHYNTSTVVLILYYYSTLYYYSETKTIQNVLWIIWQVWNSPRWHCVVQSVNMIQLYWLIVNSYLLLQNCGSCWTI